jgi:hypothetical protein
MQMGHAQTHTTKLAVTFHSFGNASKNLNVTQIKDKVRLSNQNAGKYEKHIKEYNSE